MQARFRLNGRVGEGEIIQRNSLTTLVQIRQAKLDVRAMRWTVEEKVIKRHNRKHGVQFNNGGSYDLWYSPPNIH